MEQQNGQEAVQEMELVFDSSPENESFARVAAAAFMARMDPTLEEVADVKTAVSEAVTNAVIHGYEGGKGKIKIHMWITGRDLTVDVEDNGRGIEDVKRARTPLFTTKPELERSGMGFAFMEAFMDEVDVESEIRAGTRVTMKKTIGKG